MSNMIYKTFRVDVKSVNEETGEVDMLKDAHGLSGL